MYWPCSLSAARRAADKRSLRPPREDFDGAWMVAEGAGASRANARSMDASDLRIASMSLCTDPCRGFGEEPSFEGADRTTVPLCTAGLDGALRRGIFS